MKNWWLKLYTIPALKTLLFVNLLMVVADIVVSMFFGVDEAEMVAIGYFVPIVFLWFKEISWGMVRNLQFHKSTMSFPEIRKSLICHYGIIVPLTLALGLTLGAASSALGGSAKNILEVPLLTTSIFFAISLVLATMFGLSLSKSFFHIKFTMKGNFVLNLLLSCVISFVSITGILFMNLYFKIDMGVCFFVTGLGAAAACAIFKWRAMFHLVPVQITRLGIIKYSAASVGACYVIYFALAFMGQNEHMDLTLRPEERASKISLWRPMIDSIDVSTFQDLEPHIEPYYMKDFYQLAPHSISNIPIQNFIDAKNPDRLISYLAFGKPSVKNMEFIAAHLKRNQEQWKKIDPHARVISLVAHKWPKGVVVPDHLVSFKTQREIASEKKKNTAARIVPGSVKEEDGALSAKFEKEIED